MFDVPKASYLVIRKLEGWQVKSDVSPHGFARSVSQSPIEGSSKPSRGTTVPSNVSHDRTVVLHMLYAGCIVIVLGAVVGIAGSKIVDATTGAALGAAVLGAGAAMLPTGAIVGARSTSIVKAEQPTAPARPSEPSELNDDRALDDHGRPG